MRVQSRVRRLLAVLPLALACAHTAADLLHARSASPVLNDAALYALPAPQRTQWADYLERSRARMAADKASLASERERQGAIRAAPALASDGTSSMPLNQAPAWYATPEARTVADNIVSFQTPAGGWGKNQNRNAPARAPGQWYVAASVSARGLARDPAWSYIGTIDNDATVIEIRFLAKAAALSPPERAQSYRQSAIRGLDYLMQAQLPNGGWPQVWPLQGGYHDALTLNDGAMANVAALMGDAARAGGEWHFLPTKLRTRAAAAERHAIDVLLQLQLSIDGRKTLWAQQYDGLTLTPASARSYEPAALASAESAHVLHYLMSLPAPDAEVVAAVNAGIAALRALAIAGMQWHKRSEAEGYRLTPQTDAALLWARYYDLATLQPIFGDRDGSIHRDVNTISLERRNGYAWFGREPAKAIAAHAQWQAGRR